jgi:short subunit dehydrogenase-like uncharacterized protein
MDREFEIVIWGATGFTGRLVAEFILEQYGATGELRWALGGRNREKLEGVRAELGPAAAALPLVVGDSGDDAAMGSLAERTQVVCTTVGPYALYGSKLVEACARTGTDYCDLTGEVHWMQRMIEAHQDEAVASRARIVHTCGFDSIPSDLGVLFLQREMQARHGLPCTRVELRVEGFSGGASGGTIASMLNMMEEAERNPEIRRAIAEPYALNPKDQQSGPDGLGIGAPTWDANFGQWTAPFIMADLNTKIVRRSNALLDYPYGRDFRYDEAMLMGTGPLALAKATGLALGSGAAMAAFAIGPVRRALSGRLPAPGEGPDKEKREAGYFDLRLRGETKSGEVLRARVTGDRDPGYGSTAKMLGESAVCLARDPIPERGGFLTPASAMGEPLIERLRAHAGLTFDLLGD